MGTLLQIRDLQIGATVYPPGEDPHDIKIVHTVSFDLEKGKVIGLIGESGRASRPSAWRRWPTGGAGSS